MSDPSTRRFLHGAAELLLAGPQWRAGERIDLRVVEGGFATVVAPDLRVVGGDLVTPETRIALHGRSFTEVAAEAGIEAGAPAGVYGDGPGVGVEEVLALDPAAVAVVLRAFADGDRALRDFAPEVVPILWPEHFDVAGTLDDVDYGVSPGDGHLAEPYAYVGPFEKREGAFWNAPFGAARPLAELDGAPAIKAFFDEGRAASVSPAR
ncbi:hypothetical protein MUY14_29515 [Amycolatopsis sp. FBCC-B4732]|uniref:hypothetical protein n=1 Tax=Amycolatopsis sp. FBCC-B4732 TaxID=3079339 RepID=UPI001FF2FF8F|nr:hypothetical protein [Amycolatopsis sp. FBCC-B4732]UOX85899.1 hypothetical protein MUY14_29515 [Amycolatopsis sp. FBCC-B4732]